MFIISILKNYLFYFPGLLISCILWLITQCKWFENQMLLCELAMLDEALKYDPDSRRLLDLKAEIISDLETL